MKSFTSKPTIASSRPSTERGFALVVTLSLMILLTVIAVGLLSLSSISLRSSSVSNVQMIARANAKMAMMIAIGELQKQAGPDQRVTAEASILANGSTSIAQPRWIGSWDSAGANSDNPPTSGPQWLVSGSATTPAPDPANPSSDLFVISKNPVDNTTVGVPRQTIATRNSAGASSATGRYAYWVSDEGVKARVNVTAPSDVTPASLASAERIARSFVSQSTALNKAGSEWKDVPSEQMSRLISMNSTALVTSGTANNLPKIYQHDLTADGYGLPVDVSAGGFKKDLSTIFDSPTLGSKYLGATFASGGAVGKVSFTVTDPSKFYLVDPYASKGLGPNWGILYNYNDLRRMTTYSLLANTPPVSSNVRIRNWAPYDRSSTRYGPDTYTDTQHQNSQIGPVLSIIRIGFRLSATATTGGYQLRLHVKPIIGLWNPYNVKLSPSNYTIIWATSSYLKLKITEPGGTIREPKLWLREIAINTGNASAGAIPQNYSSMDIKNVPFEPGEFRSFTVASSVVLGNTNELFPKLNGREAFFSNLTWKGGGANTPPSGKKPTDPMVVPANSEVSISEMFFDDLQTPETKNRWPAIREEDTTAYFIIRTSAGDLCRFSDMWIRSNGTTPIPEKFVGLFPTKTIETLASNVTDPDASWEIRLRTSEESGRTLRNFVDSNPRAVIMNPRWDGSTETGGWWYSSPYAGGGNNRAGLVIDPTFQSTTSGNFNHFGGNSADGNGQTRMIAFDVPRAPVTSLAQFQHAQVSRYNYEPAFAIGNSAASMRIPLDKTTVNNYGGTTNFTIADSSYFLNRRLWDSFFVSTLSGTFRGGSASVDSTYPIETVKLAPKLPNPRNIVFPQPGDDTYANIKSKSTFPAEAISSRIGIMGAFNVNSTSTVAWKTLLASLASNEIPTVTNSGIGWNQPNERTFSHILAVVDSTGSSKDAADKAFWLSFRRVDDAELNALAAEIVKEVKDRGPFRSLAEFINRNPKAASIEQRRKGALQAALDKVLNAPLLSAGDLTPTPGLNNDAFDSNEKQAAGSNGYVSQADVLQTIGPVLQARSDCFRIRSMGQALSADGKTVLAQAVCEAYIQRVATYVDSTNPPETPAANPADPTKPNPALAPVNQTFGRSMRITSFRWLSEAEI
jgi:hypothetical protein